MAPRLQDDDFKESIENLCLSGKSKQAFNLLMEGGCWPKGFGWMVQPPTGFSFFADLNVGASVERAEDSEASIPKVQPTIRQILIRDSDRTYWAWRVPDDKTLKGNQDFRKSLQDLSLPELANEIAAMEGLAWQINHDAADGRIEDGAHIDESIFELRLQARLVAEVFAQKAGLELDDYSATKERVKLELAKYDQEMKNRWRQIAVIGCVFHFGDGRGSQDQFETVQAYQSRSVGGEGVVLALEHGDGNLYFTEARERDASRLRPTKGKSRYHRSSWFLRTRGRKRFPLAHQHGQDIRETATVFSYHRTKGDKRNGTWETSDVFCRVGKPNEEIVVARRRDGKRVAEFTAGHLHYITVKMRMKPRFWKKTESSTVMTEPLMIKR